MIRICLFSLLFCAELLISSCEDNLVIPDGALDEQTVDLQGIWKVSEAFINNRDITDLLDFSQIELILEMNQGPTGFQLVTGKAPFPVRNSGKWVLNDPAYPTSMTFMTDAGERSLGFAAPPISGNSNFALSFSLGCADNTYTYKFEKQ